VSEMLWRLVTVGEVVGGRSADEPTWRAARGCESGACVEIGILDKIVIVRSSVDPGGGCIVLGRNEWQKFVAGVKDGEFDGL
jgi:hypothetical protein